MTGCPSYTHAGRRATLPARSLAYLPPAPKSMRVCIDARLVDGVPGGVQQTLIGLASGLSSLDDGDEQYRFLVHRDNSEWLSPHVAGRCSLLPVDAPTTRAGLRAVARALVPRSTLDRLMLAATALRGIHVPPSDRVIEEAGIDVMHFAQQHGFSTRVPSIYVPHDLQHRHHPEFFSRYQLLWREAFYPFLAHQATQVVALTRSGKRDIVETLGIPAERVRVIGWAPVLDAYPSVDDRALDARRARLDLPPDYAFYPAQTFRHKNHERLMEALALLRKRGLRVPLICSGRRGDAYPAVARRIRRLGLADQVKFLGFVHPADMQALYRFARLVVFPSLFEGFGMPVQEAFLANVPVACSSTTSLPEIAGDAAFLFDPCSVEAMSTAIARVWTDGALASVLVERGRQIVAGRTWLDVARTYRALYRMVGGQALGETDRALLSAAS